MYKFLLIFPAIILVSCCSIPFSDCYYEYRYRDPDNKMIHNFKINDSIIMMMEAELYELDYQPDNKKITCTILSKLRLYNDTHQPLTLKTSDFTGYIIFKNDSVPLKRVYPALDTILYPNPSITEKILFLEFSLSRKNNFFKQDFFILDAGDIRLNDSLLHTIPAKMILNRTRVKP